MERPIIKLLMKLTQHRN